MKLALAAYSFRDYFKDMTHERSRPVPAAERMDMMDFIDYCAARDVAAEATSYYFPKDVDRSFLLELKRKAFLRGVAISGTSVGNRFTYPVGAKREEQRKYVKKWIDHAATMGAPHLRVFAGGAGDLSFAEAMRLCVEGLKEALDHAGERGVMLGLENHGGIVAGPDALLEIVTAIDHPWLGINVDSANFHTDDPYRDFEACAPYAVNAQIKTEIRRKGSKSEPADLERIVSILRKAGYQGFVALEYEAAEDPQTAVPAALERLRGLLRAEGHSDA